MKKASLLILIFALALIQQPKLLASGESLHTWMSEKASSQVKSPELRSILKKKETLTSMDLSTLIVFTLMIPNLVKRATI